ncbi:MAG: tetratricopeptide repeat protein, partial [Aureibaculum sp.]
YSLGLLLAELERTNDAIEQLTKAGELMPENSLVYYNLSLLFDKKKDHKNAEQILIKGLKKDENNENLFYALVYHYSNYGDPEKAKIILTKLVEQFPDNPQYLSLLQQLN